MTVLFESDVLDWGVDDYRRAPIEVRITPDGVESQDDDESEVANNISLVIETAELSCGLEDEADDTDSLVDRFAEIDGVVPPPWFTSPTRIQIPLIDPDVANANELRWRIQDDVWLVHTDRRTAFFDAPDVKMRSDTLRLDFTRNEARRVLQVFASVNQWQRDLLLGFAQLAVDRRKAFIAQRETAPF